MGSLHNSDIEILRNIAREILVKEGKLSLINSKSGNPKTSRVFFLYRKC